MCTLLAKNCAGTRGFGATLFLRNVLDLKPGCASAAVDDEEDEDEDDEGAEEAEDEEDVLAVAAQTSSVLNIMLKIVIVTKVDFNKRFLITSPVYSYRMLVDEKNSRGTWYVCKFAFNISGFVEFLSLII